MNRSAWKIIEYRLECWGEYVSRSINAGYRSKSPIVEVMEYGVRTGTSFEILPAYEFDRHNLLIHHALLSIEQIDPRLYNIAYLENVWHHIEDTNFPRGRKKMRMKKRLSVLEIKRTKYNTLKSNLFYYLLPHCLPNSSRQN